MKRRSVLLVMVLVTSLAPSARSVRPTQPASVSRTQNSVGVPSAQPELGSEINTAQRMDKYKLIFKTESEGKLEYLLRKEKAEMMRARASALKNFLDKLNETGKQGYKVASTLPTNLAAVVVTDETNYEYRLFETRSAIHFIKSGLFDKLEGLSKAGFRLIEHSQLYTLCEYIDPENLANGETCEYEDRFLAEKQIGTRTSIEQIIVNAFPGWGAKTSQELEKLIGEKMAEGFYPVKAISKFEILLEKTKYREELLADKPEVKVLRTDWGAGRLEKKVNELANQGYRLALAREGIVVMYRHRDGAHVPTSYSWIRTDKKLFERDLANLQSKGAVYRIAYANPHGITNILIFEQTFSAKHRRGEFKTLRFEFNSIENKAERKVYTDLTPISKEAVKKMNKLAGEDFMVRGMFHTDKPYSAVNVILERVK